MSTRAAFRPSRPRASLSSLPSTSIPLALDGDAKENGTAIAGGEASAHASTSTSTSSRRKRAQSLGGAALDDERKKRRRSSMAPTTGELSPGKLARRKLVPRRSILKAKPAIFDEPTSTISFEVGAHTTDLSSLSTTPFTKKRRQSLAPPTGTLADPPQEESEEEDESSDDGEMDMDMTGITMNEDRRKSLARRVSFAPNAHIRTFTPDKPTAQAQLLLQQQQQQLYQQQQQEEDENSDDLSEADRTGESMEMATDITHAFAGHFAGTVPVSVYEEDSANSARDDATEAYESEDDGEDMEVAEGDVTSAYASQFTVVHNSGVSFQVGSADGSPEKGKGKAKPRFSEVARQEDAEDAAAMAELGLARGAAKPKPRFSEVARKEDAEDAELLRQLGLQKGRAAKQNVSFGGVPSSEDDEEDVGGGEEATMDLTMAIGKVLSQQAAEEEDEAADVSVDMSFATIAPADQTMDLDDEDQTTEMDDQTTNMVEATQYGGIITSTSASVPSVPAVAPPLPSAAVPSTPSARLKAQLFQRQSLGGAVPTSPRPNSPRRVTSTVSLPGLPAKSPAKPPPSPRRIVSPVKQAAPGSPSTPRRASRVSASPMKKPTTPSFVNASQQLGLANSARRTPGGSLSLKGLMEEQRQLGFPPPSSLASPKPSPAPAARRWDSPRGVGTSRVEEIRAAQVPEEDSTGSSYGLYGDEENASIISSLDAFFEATEMHFHKDISGFAGVDLKNKSRKSVAPQVEGREPSGPPSFADHIVAGACKALFHSLYRSDQTRLSEDIEQTIQSLASVDEALRDPEQQPTVFKEWSAATEAHRAMMLNQFRMIKTHYFLSGRIDWMAYRSHNIAQIIEVMVDNLEGLRADNDVVDAAAFDAVIPDLEARHAAFRKELEEERARDMELTSCDQDDLAQLHEAIVEQTEQLKLHERQTAEAEGQLAELNLKAADFEAQELASAKENEELHRMLELGRISTKAEVFRLNAEYEGLQKLHGWKLVKFTKESVCLSHLDEFDLTLQVGGGLVRAASFTLHRRPSAVTGLSGEVTRYLFSKVIENIQWVLDPATEGQSLQSKSFGALQSIISRVSSLWTCARRLRREIITTNHSFPTLAVLLNSGSLRMTSEVHVPKAKATFNVVIEVSGEELAPDEERRPAEVDGVLPQVASDIEVKFGSVDAESLRYIIRERLDVGGRGALLEAVMEAEGKYL
ncbi:hypothetical protein P7C70_g3156, partial [Phenoliferia sp. Uapishka_3]